MGKGMWNKAQEIVGDILRSNDFLNDGLGDFIEYNVEKTDEVVIHSIYFNGMEMRVELMQDTAHPARYVVGYAQWVNEVFRWGGAYTLYFDSYTPWNEVLYTTISHLACYAFTVVQCAAYEHPLVPAHFATGTRVVSPTSHYTVYRALRERMQYELSQSYVEV